MARAPGLSEGIKYVAMYEMDDSKSLAVLAQGKDKYTLKKWASLLRVGLESLAPVDDMRKALEFAREQEGFCEHGTFSYQRGSRPSGNEYQRGSRPSGNEQAHKRVPSKPREPPKIQEAFSPPQEEEEDHLPTIYLVAREAAQHMSERLEERERNRLGTHTDHFETDLDRLYPSCAGHGQDYRMGMHLVARQAALQYVKRLEYAGRMCSQDAIPRALRAGWVG